MNSLSLNSNVKVPSFSYRTLLLCLFRHWLIYDLHKHWYLDIFWYWASHLWLALFSQHSLEIVSLQVLLPVPRLGALNLWLNSFQPCSLCLGRLRGLRLRSLGCVNKCYYWVDALVLRVEWGLWLFFWAHFRIVMRHLQHMFVRNF
jgi:hypothetical protein